MTGSDSSPHKQLHAPDQSQKDSQLFEKLWFEAEGSKEEETALKLYDQIIQLRPEYSPAYLNKATILYRADHYNEAMEVAQKAIDLDKNNAKAVLILAKCLCKNGDFEGCITLCKKVVEMDPNSEDGYFKLGKCLMETEKYQESLDAYNKVIELNSKNVIAQGNKGYVMYLMNKSNINEAVNHYDKQLEMCPLDFKAHIKKAKVLEDAGKTEEALDSFAKACEIIPQGSVLMKRWSSGDTEIGLNQKEVGLVKCVKELAKLPCPKSKSQNEKFINYKKELFRRKKSLKLRVLRMFGNRQKQMDDSLSEVHQEIEDLKHSCEHLESIIHDSGIDDLAEIKRGFRALEEKDKELHAYCKTFYWTTVNVFQAYKLMSTGLLQVNFDKIEPHDHFCTHVKKATEMCSSIAQGVPIVGDAICKMLGIIDKISKMQKTEQINALVSIIQYKFTTEADISVAVCKAALIIAKAKEKKIMYPEFSKKPEASKKGFKWLENMINNIKHSIVPSVGVYCDNSHGAALALQDVTLVVSYLSSNAEAVIARKDPLEKQIESIIKLDGLDIMLEDHPLSEPEPEKKKRDWCTFCGFF